MILAVWGKRTGASSSGYSASASVAIAGSSSFVCFPLGRIQGGMRVASAGWDFSVETFEILIAQNAKLIAHFARNSEALIRGENAPPSAAGKTSVKRVNDT